MNRNRERNSRFGPPIGPGPQNYQRSGEDPYKTVEQRAFDSEFAKWEQSFDDWKKVFANHPDRNAYRQYESKFLEVRDKLLEKRKQIYNNSGSAVASSQSPPSSGRYDDSFLSAADAMANSIITKFGSSNSAPLLPQQQQNWNRGNNSNDFRQDQFRGRSGDRGDFDRGGFGYGNRGGNFGDQGNFGNRSSSGGRNFGNNFGNNNRGNFGNDRGNYGNDRGNFGNDRGNFGNDDRGNFGNRSRDRGGFGNGGRRDDRRQSGGNGRDNRGSGGRSGDRRQNRGGGGGGFSSGGNFRQLPRPNQAQIEKELKRRDVYPFTKWQLSSTVDRPELVGKRGKKKNAKIQSFLERKKKFESGELSLEELPFTERIEKMFEIARSQECPNRLPGSGNRRLKNLRAKDPNSLTAEDSKFLAYAEFVIAKRGKYFEEKRQEREEAEQEKEQQAHITAVDENKGEKMDGVQVVADN